MTAAFSKRLHTIGSSPTITATTVPVSEATFSDLGRFCDLVYSFGAELIDSYYRGHAASQYYVEYGLPQVYRALLERTRGIRPHKTLLRYDFFLAADGPKLVEISSNPWGLLALERHLRRDASGAAPFPAREMYLGLCAGIAGKRVGIWRHFGFSDDIADLIAALRDAGFSAERLDVGAALEDYDAIFYDIETALYDASLPALLPHASRLLPSPANEILKRKNLLPLLYRLANGQSPIPSAIGKADREFMQQFLAPSHLIPDQTAAPPEFGAIKDVIGIWGMQVTVLSPHQSGAEGASARRRRSIFRRHLKAATAKRNAVLQEYISPVALPGAAGLFPEFSLVYNADQPLPFARIYAGTPEAKRSLGVGLVRIEELARRPKRTSDYRTSVRPPPVPLPRPRRREA